MTIHHSTETAPPDAKRRSPSDLNDREFGLVAPHGAQKAGSGKQRIVDIRDVLHAIFSGTRIGCQWRMLPSDAAYRARAWRCIRACPCVVGQRASRGRQYRAPVARHSLAFPVLDRAAWRGGRSITRVGCPTWLDEQQMGLLFGEGLVLDAARDDEQLARVKHNVAIP